jgi:hypothetical protein
MAQLELKTKAQLAKEAHTLAVGSELVRHRSTTYAPVDFETLEGDPVPDPGRTIWLPLKRHDVMVMAREQFDTLFAGDGELASFEFMVAQNARQEDKTSTNLLVRTEQGLKRLAGSGKLYDPTGDFVPNAVKPVLLDDKAEKARVFDVISGWLNSEEEAHALLHHLATSLAPGWSAVKYVLLLGEGRNGKSLLLRMLASLYGPENVSNVTRQDMADKSPVVTELNGKLLNIVFDGQAEYLKDSGVEKSLVAGEPAPIRRLYESQPTLVQTNALFVEGLNNEPKSKDKSSALQKRLVRFHFPNVYALDRDFERQMLSDESLGAFLSLLVDHYVVEAEIAKKLAPTAKAIELQLEHMYVNSVAMQFIKHLEDTDTIGAAGLLGEPMSKLISQFQSWRIKENDLSTWAEPDVQALFMPLVNTERRSVRVDGQPRKMRVVTSFKDEADQFIKTLKEVGDADEEAVVDE